MFVLRKALDFHYLQFNGTQMFALLASSTPMFLLQRSTISPLHHVCIVKCIQTCAENSVFHFHLKDFQCCHFVVSPRRFLLSETVGNRPQNHQMCCQNRHCLVSVLVVSAKTRKGAQMQGQPLNIDTHSHTDINIAPFCWKQSEGVGCTGMQFRERPCFVPLLS